MEYSVLSLALPGRPEEPAGVLLLDREAQRLGVKWRRDWERLADPEDAETLRDLADSFASLGQRMGAEKAFEFFDSTLSNVIRISDKSEVSSGSFDFTLHSLFKTHVPVPIEPFRTHLPRFALRSAAGLFGEQMAEANEVLEWVEAPEGLRLTKEMFVCEVTGRSMEPLIPSGSLCVFRRFGAGSRQGKRVLVEDRAEAQSGGERYTVKVYRSLKAPAEAGPGKRQRQGEKDGEGSLGEASETAWSHQAIELSPLNPEFPILRLDPDQDRYAVVAEFVALV